MTAQLDGLEAQLERLRELPVDPAGDEAVEEERLRRKGSDCLEVIVAQLRQQCAPSQQLSPLKPDSTNLWEA